MTTPKRLFRLSRKYPTVPAFATAKSVTACEPEEALATYLDAFESFEGRATMVCQGQATHLKFVWSGCQFISVSRIANRDLDLLPKSQLITQAVNAGLGDRKDILKMSKVQVLDLLDPKGTPEKVMAEEAIIMYLVSVAKDAADEVTYTKVQNERLEARLQTLEARVSWLTGELVHVKSELFLSSIPSATPSATPSSLM